MKLTDLLPFRITSKSPTPALQTPSPGAVDRLTVRQREVVTALRRLGDKTRPKRVELLKQYAIQLRTLSTITPGAGPPADKVPTRHQFEIPARLPINVPKDVRNFFRKLIDDRKAKAFKFVHTGEDRGKVFYLVGTSEKREQIGVFRYAGENEQSGTTPFGIDFLLSENKVEGKQLEVVIRYPITPSTLRSPQQKDIGDLNYRSKTVLATTAASRVSTETRRSAGVGEERRGASDVAARSTGLAAEGEAVTPADRATALAATGAIQDRIDELVNQIASPKQMGDVIGLTAPRLDNVAWQDFYAYEYVMDPEYLAQPPPPDPFTDISDLILHLEEESGSRAELISFMTPLRTAIMAKYENVAQSSITIIVRPSSEDEEEGEAEGGGSTGGGGPSTSSRTDSSDPVIHQI